MKQKKIFIGIACVLLVMLLAYIAGRSDTTSAKAKNQKEKAPGETKMTEETEDAAPKLLLPDTEGMLLGEALETLHGAGFSQISYDAQADAEPEEAWKVIMQTPPGGGMATGEAKIRLACVKVCRLYLDLASAGHLLFNTYDLEVLLDNTMIGTVSNGKHITYLTQVTAGKHRIVIRSVKNSGNSAYKEVEVTGHMTVSCTLEHDSSVSFSDWRTEAGTAGAALTVPDTVGMLLSAAEKQMADTGFINVHGKAAESIWDSGNWLVLEQDQTPGTVTDKNTPIVLSCVRLSDYITDGIPAGTTLTDAQAVLGSIRVPVLLKDSLTGTDAADRIAADEEKRADIRTYWIVEQTACGYGGITLNVRYIGTPEERAAAEAAAEAARQEQLRREEEARLEQQRREEEARLEQQRREEEARLEQERAAEKLRTLEAYLPKERAKKAVLTAFTNYDAEDVYDAAGEYAPSKFHSSDYTGTYRQTVSVEGTWTYRDDQTWNVQDMVLHMSGNGYDTSTRIRCCVTYDGTNYTLTNVKYLKAKPAYINTEDPSKTSGWVELRTGAANPFLTVPKALIK